MRSRLTFAALALAMFFVGAMGAVALHRVQEIAEDLRDSNADRTAIRAELDEQKGAATALAEQVRALGAEPVVEPTAGKNGTDGATGPRGATGSRGTDGKPGRDGKSGAKGQDGAPGATGVAGATGARGEDGSDGAPGAKGETGATGADGKPGTDGKNGADGKDGRGIETVDCNGGTGTFTFTFSDGSTRTVECSPLD